MANIKNLIDEIILEKKDDSLKIFYNIDIFISGEEEAPEPEEGGEETPEPEEEQRQLFTSKKKGELVVPSEDAKNIQTADDLIDYLADKDIDGDPVFNDVVEEMLLVIMNINTEKDIKEVIGEKDKILIEIDYGKNLTNSIGFKINKRSGTKSYSISIKKDGQIQDGAFNLKVLEQQILYYRNSII